jgi:hypothetical protein
MYSLSLRATAPATLGQSPRLSTDNLAFAVGPKVHDHSDHVVDGRVGGLIHKSGRQGSEWENGQAELEGSVERRTSDETEGPLESEHPQSKNEVDGLQNGNGSDGGVQGPGQEVPEDLGPKVSLNSGGDLVDSRRHDDEPSPVVLDKLAHFDEDVVQCPRSFYNLVLSSLEILLSLTPSFFPSSFLVL